MGMPVRELRGPAKTGLVAPGASEVITIEVPVESLMNFDEFEHQWKPPKGSWPFQIDDQKETIII